MENNNMTIESSEQFVKEELSKDNYAFDKDNEHIKDEIASMNFIEVNKFKSDLALELENLKNAKEMIDAIDNIEIPDELNRKVAIENILNDNEYKEDAKNFLNSYDKNVEYLNELISLCEERSKVFDIIEKTSSFFNNEMVDILNKKIKNMIEKNSLTENAEVLEPFRIALDVFSNRQNIDFIKELSQKNGAVKKCKRDIQHARAKTIKNSIKSLTMFFNKNQLAILERYLMKTWDNDTDAVLSFLTHLAKSISYEKKSGKYNYIKGFIMNILDIEAGIYDLEGGRNNRESGKRNASSLCLFIR